MRRRECLASLVSLLACNGADAARSAGPRPSSSARADTSPIELFSWWPRIGDSDALDALAREHQRLYPNDVIINATADLSGLARSTLRARMQRNEPPDTFQANVGKDLMQWVLVNGLDVRESKLLPLDDFIADVGVWRQTMPRAVIDELTYDGKLYAVPANVHRVNAVFYNKEIFRQYGLTEPRTIDDLKAMGRKLEGSGITPLAVGSREPWTLALFFFECLLVALEGSVFYGDYFRGRLRPDDPRMQSTLREALELLDLVNADHANLSWYQALELVERGAAAMTPMGDWAHGSLNARGKRVGDDYVEIAFPQTDETFVYTSDTFPLPVLAKNRAGAIRLLRTIGSVDGQRTMNAAKMALSPRRDVAPPDEPKLAEKHALLQHGELVLALSGLVPQRFADDVAGALAEMSAQRDIEPVLQTLRSRYALLR